MILSEHGYEEAMLGLSLSYNTSVERAREVALKLAHKQGGHNKFLESIYVWMDMTFPRKFWQQFDTYRIATKQSESTMHTILKNNLQQKNFVRELPQEYLDALNELISLGEWEALKDYLPEGFLQRRIVCVSYKTLQNIVKQRQSHKLKEWQDFINGLMFEIEHPYYIKETK